MSAATSTMLPARFWDKVHVTDDCWIWTGAQQSRGYGSFGIGDRRSALAHRLAYEDRYGPIADDLTVDHLCRTKTCVNPGHLELVTRAENVRRVGKGSVTHCKRGHELSGPNLRIKLRGPARPPCRNCRACEQLRRTPAAP